MSYLEQQAYAQKLCTEGIKRYKEGNVAEAIKLWNVASENNSNEAKYCIALQHISGKYIAKDLDKAISLLDQAARNGSEKAMYTLADIYEKGSFGISQNHDKSVEYYSMYVKKGSPEAVKQVMKIGRKYEREMGISMINNAIAVKYYEIAADTGNLDAIMKAADIHGSGIGRMFDRRKSVKYYSIAAEHGIKDAIESMATIYQKGLYDVPKDEKKYVELSIKLANLDLENERFQKRVLSFYTQGTYGVEKDNSKAVEMIRKLADLDINEGRYKYMLAEIYENGDYDVEQNQKKAVEIYFDLIKRYPNNQDYQLKMAGIFEEGKYGVVQDVKKASLIYSNLVNRFPENALYQYCLGKINYNNKDAECQKTAYHCFSHAYDLGNKTAGFFVVELLFKGGAKFPKDFGKAVQITEKLIKRIKDSYTLPRDEQTAYRNMICYAIQMYAKGGPNLEKNVKRAKEILGEYNLKHEDRIKVHI